MKSAGCGIHNGAEAIDKGPNGNLFRLNKITEMVNNELINDFRYDSYLTILLNNLTSII